MPPHLISALTSASELRPLCAYEDGGAVLQKGTAAPENKQTVKGRGWEVLWKFKLHVKSGLSRYVTGVCLAGEIRRMVSSQAMSMTVFVDRTFALTMPVDHVVRQCGPCGL
jgi:hypothetical protein